MTPEPEPIEAEIVAEEPLDTPAAEAAPVSTPAPVASEDEYDPFPDTD